MNIKRINAFYLVMVLLTGIGVLPMMSGCAGGERTTHTEATVTRDANGQVVTSTAPAPATAQSTTQTHTTTTEVEEHPHGFFDVIGSILAFPFKLIGGILEAIF
jgi:hypothetical protein